MNKVVQIHRDIDDGKQTLGRLYVFDGNEPLFNCKTLELPWLDNEKRDSCIPKGQYTVKKTYSPRFKTQMYLVTNVENRSGIRIHSANYVEQLSGCIALGSIHKDINLDGRMDIVHSSKTCRAFEAVLENLEFDLEIYNFTHLNY